MCLNVARDVSVGSPLMRQLLVSSLLVFALTACSVEDDGAGGDVPVGTEADASVGDDAVAPPEDVSPGLDVASPDDIVAPPADLVAPPDTKPLDAVVGEDAAADGAGNGGDASPDTSPACLEEDGSPCDDDRVCTDDRCDEAGACTHPLLDDARGQQVPRFALVDANTLSATSGQTIDLDEALADTVVVLVFHSALCESCVVQGEAARPLVAELTAEPGVLFATVNDVDGSDYASNYATFDSDGEAPLTGLWPILQDTSEARVWTRYCATNNDVFVIAPGGLVRYNRSVNFTDPPFVNELRDAIGRARLP